MFFFVFFCVLLFVYESQKSLLCVHVLWIKGTKQTQNGKTEDLARLEVGTARNGLHLMTLHDTGSFSLVLTKEEVYGLTLIFLSGTSDAASSAATSSATGEGGDTPLADCCCSVTAVATTDEGAGRGGRGDSGAPCVTPRAHCGGSRGGEAPFSSRFFLWDPLRPLPPFDEEEDKEDDDECLVAAEEEALLAGSGDDPVSCAFTISCLARFLRFIFILRPLSTVA